MADWFRLSKQETMSQLTTGGQGLDSREAKERLKQYGENVIEEAGRKQWWQVFLEQFKDLLVIILIVAAGISMLTGDPGSAGVIFAVLLLHERMTMKKVVCIVSAVAGAVCIVGGDAGGGHILGIALSLGSVLTWSALSVFMRSFTQKYDALTVTTCGIYVAAIGTLPLMLREIITHPEMDFLHAKYILVLFYVAIFCTTIPHSLWNYCLSRAEASTCSLFYPIQPLTSMVLGVLLLNEHMTVGFIVGAVLIVFGVLYSTLGKEKNR